LSAHVSASLSAYLDGELAAADRQTVEAHLQLCDECGRHLEDLAAVDELARALPLEAPGGYFEALPARVRFKVAPRRRQVPKLPVWSWAVAAALVLAVVTPALLRRNSTPAELARRVTPAPGATAPAAGAAAERRGDEKEQSGQQPAQGARPAVEAERRATRSYDEVPPASRQVAAAPPVGPAAAPASSAGVAQGSLARNAGTAPLARREEATAKDKALEAAHQEPNRSPSAPGAAAALAPPPEEGQLEGAAGQHLYESKPESDADDAPVAALAESKRAGSAKAARPRDAEAGRSEAPAPRLHFRTLLAEVPGDAEEMRRLREQWRAFVAQRPPAGQADEGRVRIVELGVQAWRLSNDPADLNLLKRDAEAYLRRDDAAQGDRVRSLLATVGN
jgi:Putative zinc-finger